jgi:MOSC domain-containing protein YiiM
MPIEVVMLLASPQHRYEGRPADGPIPPMVQETHESIAVRAGLGVVGDRYFGQRAHRTASVTFFAVESLEHVERVLDRRGLDPQDTRRNVITRGLDVDRLRDQVFAIDGVRFRGHRPANPCAWMDTVYGPGAFTALRGRGGIRCEPLDDGVLRVGPALARLQQAEATLF